LEYLITLLGDLRGREGNKGTDTGSGSNEGKELGVKKLDSISLSRKEGVDNFLRDGKGLLGVGVLGTLIDRTDGVFTTLEVFRSLLSNEDHITVNALGFELLETGLGLLDHEGVVSSAKTTVSSDNTEGDLVHLTLSEKGKVSCLTSQTADKSTENALESLREGTGGHHTVLSTTHLSGSDELHGTGDLLSVVNSGDTVTDGVGLTVHNNGGTTGSVGGRLVGEHIVQGGGGGSGGEGSRAGGESLGGGKNRGGDGKKLHG